jgi:hypothetical protein
VPPCRRTVRSPTSMSATVAGTNFRPPRSYTTLRDVTHDWLGRGVALATLA